MRVTETILLASLMLALKGGLLVAGPLVESGSTASLEVKTLTAESRHEEGPGLLPVDRAYVRSSTNSFAFIIPTGLKLESWSDGRVALVTRDYGHQITFGIMSFMSSESEALNPETCSQWVLVRQPRAQIRKTFSAFADSRPGPAFEFDFVGVAGATRRGLIAYIPSRVGILEFGMASSPEDFESVRRQFKTLMLTFRASDANGKLNISPLSDKL